MKGEQNLEDMLDLEAAKQRQERKTNESKVAGKECAIAEAFAIQKAQLKRAQRLS